METNSRVSNLKSTSMNCERYELMIFDLPFSTREADVDIVLLKHVSQCSSCEAMLTQHLAGMQQINESRRVESNSFFYQRLISRMENNKLSGKVSNTIGNRILRFSPALISAAAALFFGVWIGGQLTLNLQTAPVNSSDSRELMFNAVAEDLNLIDVSESALETYLMENQNPEQP